MLLKNKIMKKSILLILVLLFSFGVFAQTENNCNSKFLISEYPELYYSYIPTNLLKICGFPRDSIMYDTGIAHVPQRACYFGIYQLMAGSANHEYYDTIQAPYGFAQIMHNDSLLNIGGVSLIVRVDSTERFPITQNVGDTILILDATTMDVLYEQVLNDSIFIESFPWQAPIEAVMYEIIFDSAIQVQGDYFIAYKYNPANTYILSAGRTEYAMHLYCYNLMSTNSSDTRILNDNNSSADQVYYYRPNLGWKSCLDYRDYFSYPTTSHNELYYTITMIEKSAYFTDLYPTDRTIMPHTTELCVFTIPEYAINRQADSSEVSSITEINENVISITPNPTNDIVNVYCDYMMYFAEIYDLQGTKLEAKEINAYQTSLSLAKYPDGIYLMKINTDKGFITKRIIKQ